ncbi:MAG: tetratricopeptide repeat protein, partial [Acidobacteria bacterium]|nr:tetratricopeptide repeat protein [Acidobacteriota bacterium]
MFTMRQFATCCMIVGLAAAVPSSLTAQKGRDQELFNQAKILMFDRNWADAGGVFQRIMREYPGSSIVPQAWFFHARCLQLQGKLDEALPAYEEFLGRYPKEPFLPAEARNAVVEMAASLLEKGDPSHKDRLTAALSDASKDVRYFAALRCSHLKDRYLNSMIVPILK